MKTTIDLKELPDGARYEDRYGGYLQVFKIVAELQDKPHITNCPVSWAPLFAYLGASIGEQRTVFPEDDWLSHEAVHKAKKEGGLRRLAEIYSAIRPELVDAMYKSDVEWKTVGRDHKTEKEFTVTCNASFYRPEVLNYINNVLPSYKPKHDKCVLVPCAADKPYPAELHKAVRSCIPDTYEIIIATGVLGLVPEGLWDQMPLYDSGLPNELRLEEAVAKFFGKWKYSSVAVYSDFYNKAIKRGFDRVFLDPLRDPTRFVTSVRTYTEYLNLLDPELLAELRRVTGG